MQNLTSSAELKTPGCLKTFGTIASLGLFISTGAFLLFGVDLLGLPDSPIIYFGFMCSSFLVIGTISLLATVLSKMAYQLILRVKLDDPVARGSNPVRPGEAVRFEYEQKVNSATNVSQTRIQLILREWVKYQSGTDTYTKTHEYVIEEQTLPGSVVNPGNLIFHRVQLRMPQDAMHSFIGSEHLIAAVLDNEPMMSLSGETNLDPVEEAEMRQQMAEVPPYIKQFLGRFKDGKDSSTSPHHNTLRWFIRVKVAMVMWPDYTQDYQITVVPATADAQDEYGFG